MSKKWIAFASLALFALTVALAGRGGSQQAQPVPPRFLRSGLRLLSRHLSFRMIKIKTMWALM